MSQIHKTFTTNQIKDLLERYLNKEIERKYIQEILGIGKSRFFMLLKKYRENAQNFTTQYQRTTPSRIISSEIEQNIIRELTIEKKIIQNQQVPISSYNYSYIKDLLEKKYHQKVSLPTIIDRAKKHGFYLKKPKRTIHDREVLTNYTGELIQHDSSYHLWAPAAQEKWYLTDQSTPQWKQVLEDCNVKVIHSLSPQARGKIERPYGWLQDRLVRTCVREDVREIKDAQMILNQELHRYNHQQVHSTTKEIPYLRFQRALKEKRSLFREFKIRPPFQSPKDIFCLRMNRVVDSYRKISIHNFQFRVHANPRKKVNLRIYPLNKEISEIRFWCEGKLIDVQKVKNSDLRGVHF